MKKFLFLFAIILATTAFSLKAQCPLTDAVDFTAPTVEGDTVHLFDILDNEGKYVVIDFFFTTCGPCQQAAPHINDAYIYFGCNEGDVIFLAVDTGDTDEECIEFDETYGVEYPTISGVEGGGTQICLDYQIPAYPTVILIAPDHSIVEQDIWPIPNAQAVIDALEPHGLEETDCEEGGFVAGFYAEDIEICYPGATTFFPDCEGGDPISFNWYFEGGIPETSLDENPAIYYQEVGSYDVQLIVSDGENIDTAFAENYISVLDCVGVSESKEEDFSIYPNPANGKFNLNLGDAQFNNANIIITDAMGKVVYRQNDVNLVDTYTTNIDLSAQPQGIYFVTVSSDTRRITKKLFLRN